MQSIQLFTNRTKAKPPDANILDYFWICFIILFWGSWQKVLKIWGYLRVELMCPKYSLHNIVTEIQFNTKIENHEQIKLEKKAYWIKTAGTQNTLKGTRKAMPLPFCYLIDKQWGRSFVVYCDSMMCREGKRILLSLLKSLKYNSEQCI